MKTINANHLHVEYEKTKTTVDCISDTAIANHHIRMSAWIYWIKEFYFWGMQCIPHSFNFIERCSCHWLLNVTLQLAPATAVLELIGQFFCSYTCWNFMSCLHCTQVWCPAVCAKLLNMMFKWIVDKTEVQVICWFCWLIFDFAMAEIYKCCWLWIPCLDHVKMERWMGHAAMK